LIDSVLERVDLADWIDELVEEKDAGNHVVQVCLQARSVAVSGFTGVLFTCGHSCVGCKIGILLKARFMETKRVWLEVF
jgi:hypothetical protein